MALRFRRRASDDPTADLRSVLGDLELPTFPGAVMKSLETLRRPESSAEDVADALSADPGMTVRLLKLVNSPSFGIGRPVTSVSQAAAIAGFGAIESMVLSVGVHSSLPRDVEGIDNARFWRAASRRATVARAFAAELHPVNANLCFTAGLLSDMAVPLLASARPEYRPILSAWHEGEGPLHELELAAFGWAHDQVAATLCRHWELPEALAEAIDGHHGHNGDDAPPAVQLAGPFPEVDETDIRELVIERAGAEFGLDAERSGSVIDEAVSDAVELANLFT